MPATLPYSEILMNLFEAVKPRNVMHVKYFVSNLLPILKCATFVSKRQISKSRIIFSINVSSPEYFNVIDSENILEVDACLPGNRAITLYNKRNYVKQTKCL